MIPGSVWDGMDGGVEAVGGGTMRVGVVGTVAGISVTVGMAGMSSVEGGQ